MERIVVELKGNLTFCGVDKGEICIEGENGILVETDTKSGLKVWCPIKSIVKKHEIRIEEW